jgi:hypothetical protein
MKWVVPRTAVFWKTLFSESKKQKTFAKAVAALSGGTRQIAKVFWFFFSKKNCFLTPPLPSYLPL